MNEKTAREQVASAGRRLLEEGLVARTWGNVSCRTGESSFAITPSGLGYEHMGADDIVAFDMQSGEWRGSRKPSSEKGVHAAAYRQFPDAGFVIHTHQCYATALGLAGFETLSPDAEERKKLGPVALADYALPGTKKLVQHVSAAMAGGARAVLMAHHGALIIGKDCEEAFVRARLLEVLCKRACQGQPRESAADEPAIAALSSEAKARFGHAAFTASPAVLAAGRGGRALRAQLDDMAQMIGPSLRVAKPAEALRVLEKHAAVLVEGLGAIARAGSDGDCEALCMLIDKSCCCALHTKALGKTARLSALDARLMRIVYQQKYAKKMGG